MEATHIIKVFICSALRGERQENIKKAKEYCRWAALECGAIPTVRLRNVVLMHLLFPQFLDDCNEIERELGINMGLEFLKDCSELWYFGDSVTQGMVAEITKAHELNIPVRYVSENEMKNNQYENGGLIYG